MAENNHQFVLQMLEDLDEHEWIKYQRYLAEHERQHGKISVAQPLDYQEFRAWLTKTIINPQDIEYPL